MIFKVIDGHCDVLSKMYMNPQIDFHNDRYLDVTLPRMQEANMLMQLFAIYLPQSIQAPTLNHIVEFISLFHQKINSEPGIHWVKSVHDLQQCHAVSKIGAMLTLEGADAIQGNLAHIKTLYELGVRCLGITWNYANWAADGVMEPRQGGFTIRGKELIHMCNEIGMILDVSHLTERAFWDLNEETSRSFIASHSNAYHICKHPRNLRDDQMESIIQTNGRIGITFVPYFVKQSTEVKIHDILHHIDHICSLGGQQHIVFGSDFDGIDQWITGLEHCGKYKVLYELLCKHYKESEVKGFLYENWTRFFEQNLPR